MLVCAVVQRACHAHRQRERALVFEHEVGEHVLHQRLLVQHLAEGRADGAVVQRLGHRRPLPGHENVVVTRRPVAFAEAHPGVTAVGSLDAAIAWASEFGAKTVSVIGGGEIYAQALPLADELVLTHVPEEGGGDVFFPEIDLAQWTETSRERVGAVEIVRLSRAR